jgi:tRNA threonylcarbamoyladenosine biosynthesis protein TsaB
MTVLLALDSSTESMALALVTPAGRLLHEGEGGAKASAQMVPAALALLAQAGLALADVDAIAYGQGPGAFTGLRTACAVAQGLALGAAKPVLAIDSLMQVAEDARQQAAAGGIALGDTVWVAMDARMNEIYAAAYRWQDGLQGGRWQPLAAPALYSAESLNARWAELPPAAVAGSALVVFGAALQTGEASRWPEPRSRAAALAELSQQAWDAGAQRDAAEAMPVYVRDKVAFTTAERLAARTPS